MRAAIYARFSTDLQSERSIEDQLDLCRAYAAREKLDVVATFEDRARSGGSILGRDGLMSLMESARERAFEVVVVEALDRLSRDMEDLAGLHKRLSFLDVQIRAVHEGTVNTVLVGLRGLVGQLYREDNAHKVRRGQAGRVRSGLAGGGLTYGYAPVAGSPGERVIVEAEAAIVRRVFAEYTAGRTPRDIAGGLNRDGVRPPRGARWGASALHGTAERGSGLLHNELYAGRLVWNKVRMVKDPDTGRRVSRPNPEAEWQRAHVPALAIVSADLFAAVQARRAQRTGKKPWTHRRPRHLLSGLLRCGACGAGMSTKGRDKSGRVRIECSAEAQSGTCPDPRTFYLETVEKAVLSGLTAELRAPAVLAEFVREYHAERQRLARQKVVDRARLQRRVAELNREVKRCGDIMVAGTGPMRDWGDRMSAAAAERDQLLAELAQAPEPENVVAFHPATLKRYEEVLSDLQSVLAAGIRAGDTKAAEAIRDLVRTVTVTRDEDRHGGVKVDIAGRLNALLSEAAYPNGVRGRSGGIVGSGRGT